MTPPSSRADDDLLRPWTYKFEEAARQGGGRCSSCTRPSPRPMAGQVVRNSNSGGLSYLDAPDKNKIHDPPLLGVDHLMNPAQALFLVGRGSTTTRSRSSPPTAAASRVAALGQLRCLSLPCTRSCVAYYDAQYRRRGRRLACVRMSICSTPLIGIISALKPDLPGPDKIYNGAIDNGVGRLQHPRNRRSLRAVRARHPRGRLPFSAGRWKSRGFSVRSISPRIRLWPLKNIVAGINQGWRPSARRCARHGDRRQRRLGP